VPGGIHLITRFGVFMPLETPR